MDGSLTTEQSIERRETIAIDLARFARRLALDDVPPHVSLRARHLMLDAIGCGLASRGEAFAARFADAMGALSEDDEAVGRSGVVGFDRRLPMRDAMLFNGVLMHGLDYDDTHMAGVIHLSVAVLPAVLSLAARKDLPGRDLLAGYIAGLECGARLASVVKGGFHLQGFHPTGLIGAFASAFATGRLSRLDEAQLADAQGIVLSLGSGNMQFLEDGAWTKRIHPGWAAQAGYHASTMARHGVVGPGAPYSGRYGLYNVFVGDGSRARNDLSLATRGIDADGRADAWEIENVAIKPFPMCHFVHAATDAAIRLHDDGLVVDDIRAVEVLMPAGVVQVVCEPQANKRRPVSDYDAKFSTPYAVASGLLRGRLGLKELLPSAYEDPAALALMDKTTYAVDPDTTFPAHYTGELRVTMNDGRVVRHREPINRGHAERPLSNDDIVDKFFDNATLHFPRAHAAAIRDCVVSLDTLPSARTLEDLLAHGPESAPR